MTDISKHTLIIIIIIIICYFLVTTSQTVAAKYSFQQNGTNNSKQIQQTEKDVIDQISINDLTTLDYYFFSYNVIDHKTLLVRFDVTRTILFQQTQILYDAYLYISKIPAINYKINIGPFSGIYETVLHGTITDHFTFCLVLIPNQHEKKFNKTKTIFHRYLKSSLQQKHILHYCTKMGPDEDRYHHLKKQGSKGDRVLLVLQIIVIGIFLVIIQIAHSIKKRKYKEWYLRQLNTIRHELASRKQYSNSSSSHSILEMLRFKSIKDEESQEEREKKEEESEEELEDSLTFPDRQLLSPTKRIRNRSASPSIGSAHDDRNDPAVEFILESKPWLQMPQENKK